jgi:hypothetical protein
MSKEFDEFLDGVEKQTMYERYQEYLKWLNEPTEISDEEIENFVNEEFGTIRTDFDMGVIHGMKLYREQLKQKQKEK